MPKNNIETAIKRASGLLKDGGALETATYEATFGTTGLVIETLTDKKTRTIASLKSILKKGYVRPCEASLLSSSPLHNTLFWKTRLIDL